MACDIDRIINSAMASEQPCYTIINSSHEADTSSEQQIKHDLGDADVLCIGVHYLECISCSRAL